MAETYDALKLENQLCFPLYACAKEVVRKYKPYLDKLDLTYTQYITMMVLWEYGKMNVKELGKYLFLDSGTLTPVLKTLEQKKFITRTRDGNDERVLDVSATAEGMQLREEAADIPVQMGKCINLSRDEAKSLYALLYKILAADGKD
ncbi:MAG TPA: MarR family transcriptional regulator [Treponema sp.]|nr:MarR family transcriptional regulator [Treponema sp.]